MIVQENSKCQFVLLTFPIYLVIGNNRYMSLMRISKICVNFGIKITLFYSIVIYRHLYFQQSYLSSATPTGSVNTSSFNIVFHF